MGNENPVRFLPAILLAILPAVVTSAIVPKEALHELTRLPLRFEPNRGQVSSEARFLSRGPGYTLFLTDEGAVLNAGRGRVLRMTLRGSDADVRSQPGEALSGRVNYLRGSDPDKWLRGVPTYGSVRYPGVYEGVDLVFYGNPGQLEYDFVVEPGADPSPIAVRFDGMDDLRLVDGRLVAKFGDGEIVQPAPIVYQLAENGARESIEAGYILGDNGELRFKLGHFDSDRQLVIDPEVIYSSHYGGRSAEEPHGVAVDGDGNSYVCGITTSDDLPTVNAIQPATPSVQGDAFITKINPDGRSLAFSTYFGGDRTETAYDIAIADNGDIFVTGDTISPDFPTTPGAFAQTGRTTEAFVLRISNDGQNLIYSSVFGGERSDQGFGIALRGLEAYVVGATFSNEFPISAGAAQSQRPFAESTVDGFALHLSEDGSQLMYSTYLAGDNQDRANGVAVDAEGNAHVIGTTQSDNFPTTPGALFPNAIFPTDAFVSKIAPDGRSFVYSTYFGGDRSDTGQAIKVDKAGYTFITGSTGSLDLPVSAGAFQSEKASRVQDDAYVAKLSRDGSRIIASTYLGGSNNDRGDGLDIDSGGRAYIVGETASTDFPTVVPTQEANAGRADLFVSVLDHDFSRLEFSTYHGGQGEEAILRGEGGNPMAVDQNCKPYMAGQTQSADLPTVNPFQDGIGGSTDAAVAKFDADFDDDRPTIACRGVVLATLVPQLRWFSRLSIATAFGRDFAPAGTDARDPETTANGTAVSTNLANTCVEVAGQRSAMLAVFEGQVNFQLSHLVPNGWVPVLVIRGCGTPNEVSGEPEYIMVGNQHPAFFNLVNSDPMSMNPIAALHGGGPMVLGPPGLFPSAPDFTTPGAPGEAISAFFTGGGATTPALEVGQIPVQVGITALVSGSVAITLGGRAIPRDRIFFVGAAPCCAGLYQVVFFIPDDMPPGNHKLVITINGESSPESGFIAVGP